MRNYHGRFPQPWSHYRFDATVCAIAADQLIGIARRLGFELPRASIKVAELEHSTAIRIGCGPTSEDRDYLQYPLEERTSSDCPVIVKSRVTEELLRHLHAHRWRAMRRDAMHGGRGGGRDMHYDCTPLGRWGVALKRNRPELVTSHTQEYRVSYPLDVRTSTGVRTGAGTTTVTHDSILLPLQLPDTMRLGMSGRRLREVLTLPSCGDEVLDHAALDEGVYQVEDERAGSRQRTRIKVFGSLREPLDPAGAGVAWRRLRAIRTDCDRMAPDYDTIDVDAVAARYHAQCDEALGVERTGRIPYPYEPEIELAEAA